jgi:hypothetical protein
VDVLDLEQLIQGFAVGNAQPQHGALFHTTVNAPPVGGEADALRVSDIGAMPEHFRRLDVVASDAAAFPPAPRSRSAQSSGWV